MHTHERLASQALLCESVKNICTFYGCGVNPKKKKRPEYVKHISNKAL